MTKLLIDECLSAELALMARERGHHEASHVVWIGKSGWRDWELKQVLLDEDWVLVTWNCKDFRGPKDFPGTKGVLKDVQLHAGLICIDEHRPV
jgi:predicted nuclease of predicted toxin-antitoxin system